MRGRIYVALAALGLTVLALGCGGKQIKLPDVPAVVTPAADAAQEDIYAASIKALQITKAAGDTLLGVATKESELNAEGLLTPGIHAALKSGIEAAALKLHSVNEAIRNGVTAWAELRALLQSALGPVQQLITQVLQVGGQTKHALSDTLTTIAANLSSVIPGGVQ
jgi:hypothetical protein